VALIFHPDEFLEQIIVVRAPTCRQSKEFVQLVLHQFPARSWLSTSIFGGWLEDMHHGIKRLSTIVVVVVVAIPNR
jgi:hypothetical protein